MTCAFDGWRFDSSCVSHIQTLTHMTKYKKAVAYINDVLCGLTQASLSGINDDIVEIFTDVNDMQYRIHDDEVDYLAQKYDFFHNRRAV